MYDINNITAVFFLSRPLYQPSFSIGPRSSGLDRYQRLGLTQGGGQNNKSIFYIYHIPSGLSALVHVYVFWIRWDSNQKLGQICFALEAGIFRSQPIVKGFIALIFKLPNISALNKISLWKHDWITMLKNEK